MTLGYINKFIICTVGLCSHHTVTLYPTVCHHEHIDKHVKHSGVVTSKCTRGWNLKNKMEVGPKCQKTGNFSASKKTARLLGLCCLWLHVT